MRYSALCLYGVLYVFGSFKKKLYNVHLIKRQYFNRKSGFLQVKLKQITSAQGTASKANKG